MVSTATQALSAMLRELHADRSGYAQLRELLEAQFQAALRHRAERLAELAGEIAGLVEQLEQRRTRRSQTVRLLLGADQRPSLPALLQRLPATVARTLEPLMQGLEQQVRECKQLNLRNCALITEQHALMQRALGMEARGYAES